MTSFFDWVSLADIAEALFESLMVYYFFSHFIGRSRIHVGLVLAVFFCFDLFTTYVDKTYGVANFFALFMVLFLATQFFSGTGHLKAALIYFIATFFNEELVHFVTESLFHISATIGQSELSKAFFFYMCSDILQLTLIFLIVKGRKGFTKNFYFYAALALLLASMSIISIHHSLLVVSLEKNQIFRMLAMISIPSLLAFVYFVFYLFHKMEQSLQTKLENELLQEQISYQKRAYDELMQTHDTVKGIHHDLKNHILSLEHLTKEGDLSGISKYLTDLSLIETLEIGKRITGNAVLDALLFHLEKRCLEQQIALTIDATELNIERIKEVDLVGSVGNIFDNAFEGVQNMKQADKKIYVQMLQRKKYLIVTVRNSLLEAKSLASIHTRTSSKEDQENHGFGLKNMERIAEKYAGQLNITTNTAEVTVSLVLKDE